MSYDHLSARKRRGSSIDVLTRRGKVVCSDPDCNQDVPFGSDL